MFIRVDFNVPQDLSEVLKRMSCRTRTIPLSSRILSASMGSAPRDALILLRVSGSADHSTLPQERSQVSGPLPEAQPVINGHGLQGSHLGRPDGQVVEFIRLAFYFVGLVLLCLPGSTLWHLLRRLWRRAPGTKLQRLTKAFCQDPGSRRALLEGLRW